MKSLQPKKTKVLSFTAASIFAVGFLLVFSLISNNAHAETVAEREARLRVELAQVEKEIAAQQQILSAKQRESVSIERDVAILTTQINEAKLQIRARTINIEQLSKDIGIKSATIVELSDKIETSKESLSELIRKKNELDSYSLAEIVLNNNGLSDFFEDISNFQSVKSALYSLIGEVAEARENTEVEKNHLSTKKEQENEARQQIEIQKKKIELKETEKKHLLSLSKAEEANYQKVLDDRQKRAAEIRSALFALRDSAAIPFGTALTYANEASSKTGVRPAFLLAILTQESNLGENVGSCYLTDPVTGEGKRISTGARMPKTMNPTRDVPAFLDILKRLGRDPYLSRVSCPWQVGWGGAMGPSQFIPSTWSLYEKKISSAVGVATPDPWDPKHAFMASAIFLKDLGAAGGTYSDEREAALRYYAGGNWNHPRNAFYGNEVMAKAGSIQTTMIDPLQNF